MLPFINSLGATLIPWASRAASQRHLTAIRDAFSLLSPLMILGTLAVALTNLPWPFFQRLMSTLFNGDSWKELSHYLFNGTFGILSVLVTFLLAYHLAKSYGKEPLPAGIVSLSAFFVLGGAQAMSGAGLLLAIFVGILAAELFIRLGEAKILRATLPEVIPPAVANAFSALLPAFLTVTLFGVVAGICSSLGLSNIITLFYQSLQTTLLSAATSYPAALLLAFITPFLWFFGLHGTNLVDPLMIPLNTMAMDGNLAALTAGTPPPYIVNKAFFDSFVNLGGTGATFGLVIAIYLVGHQQTSYRDLTKLSFGPGLFNINEPILFGLPIVLNPLMFLPFILVPMVLTTVAYFAMKVGYVPVATVLLPWVTPPIIGGILTTSSLAGGILAALNLLISVVIYLPFVRHTAT